jgi:hypothetical protein
MTSHRPRPRARVTIGALLSNMARALRVASAPARCAGDAGQIVGAPRLKLPSSCANTR